MEYVIPVVLVVLPIGGFVTFVVLNATRNGGPVADGDGCTPGIERLGFERERPRPASEQLADRDA